MPRALFNKNNSIILTVISSVIIVLIINIISYFAFPYQTYSKSSVLVDLHSNHKLVVWSMIAYKHQDEKVWGKKVVLNDNNNSIIEIPISKKQAIKNIAIYLKLEMGDTLKIRNIRFITSSDTLILQNPKEFIQYGSTQVKIEITEKKAIITSSKIENNWVMINYIEDAHQARSTYINVFLNSWINILLLILLYIIIATYLQPLMGAINKVKETIGKDYRLVILLLWVIGYPFNPMMATPLLIISILFYIIQFKSFGFHRISVKNYFKYYIFNAIYVSFLFIYLLYVDTPDREQYYSIASLTLLLIPIPFFNLSKVKLTLISSAFIGSIILYLLVSTITFISQNPLTQYEENFVPLFRDFFYKNWHPGYFSLLMVLGYLALSSLTKKKYLKTFYLLIGITSTLLIDSRSSLIAFIIIGIIEASIYVYKNYNRYIVAVVILLALVAFSWWWATLNISNKIEARTFLWKASYELIKENPVLGIGAHNVSSAINESSLVVENIKYRNYNAHNQFLEVLVGNGLVGFVLFIGFLIYPLRYSSNYKYLTFLLVVSFLFSFESFLVRQAGMSIFAFWYVYFYKLSLPSNPKEA